MKHKNYLYIAILVSIFSCSFSSAAEEKNQKVEEALKNVPDFNPIKKWAKSFSGKSKEYIYKYFKPENVTASTWKFEGKDELLLECQFRGIEVSFYFGGDSVVLTSFDYTN